MTPQNAITGMDALLAELARTVQGLRSPPPLATAEATLAEARERRAGLWERYIMIVRTNPGAMRSLGSIGAARRTEEATAALAIADADIRTIQTEVDRLREEWAPAFEAALQPYRVAAARMIWHSNKIIAMTDHAARAAHQQLAPLPYIPPT